MAHNLMGEKLPLETLTETSQICISWKSCFDEVDKLHLNIKDRLKYFITSVFIFTKILYHELVRDAPIVYNSKFTPALNLPYRCCDSIEFPVSSPMYQVF